MNKYGAALAVGISFAALTMATASGQAPTIKLCSGAEGGVYYQVADIISSFGTSIENISTQGTSANMDAVLAGECDAFIGQPDGPVYLKRTNPGAAAKIVPVMKLHREYLHVLCNKLSGVEDLKDLNETTPVAIGAPGSGGWLIWQNFIAEDDSYESIPVTADGGIVALTSVASGQAACMTVPSGVPSSIVAEADASYGDEVWLVGGTDKDFNDAENIDGTPLYEWADIPTSNYPNTFDHYFGDIETVSWQAGLYVNKERLNGKSLEAFLRAATKARPMIISKFGK